MAIIVTGDQALRIHRKLAEIQRQLHLQQNGYGFDPEQLDAFLQRAVEGQFQIETQPGTISTSQVATPTSQATFELWMSRQVEFWAKFGVKIPLYIPNIPKSPIGDFCLPIYNPGTMNDEQLAETVLKPFRKYWVSEPLLNYSHSEATGKPSLVLVRDTTEPDKEHLGKSANDAVAYTEKHKVDFLDRQNYIILFAFHVFVTGKNLDVRGWTRFPNNRLPGGLSARGYWNPRNGRVYLDYDHSGLRVGIAGPREGKFFSL